MTICYPGLSLECWDKRHQCLKRASPFYQDPAKYQHTQCLVLRGPFRPTSLG